MTDYRAHFDAEISFANGGGLQAEAFRIDLPTADLTSEAVGELFVRHLGLALVSEVVLKNFQIVEEQHRGSRGVIPEEPTSPGSNGGRSRIVDLTHAVEAPLQTTGHLASLDLASLVGLPAEVFHLEDVSDRGIRSSIFFDRDLAGAAVLLHTGVGDQVEESQSAAGAPFLTEEGARHLANAGVAAVGIDAASIGDVTESNDHAARALLLAAGIHVIEGLTRLSDVPARGARFSAVPPASDAVGASAVRAFAEVF